SLCVFYVPATAEIYPLSLHDALPISQIWVLRGVDVGNHTYIPAVRQDTEDDGSRRRDLCRCQEDRRHGSRPVYNFLHNRVFFRRSEEHTSELQSRENLVCRLLLEKKK